MRQVVLDTETTGLTPKEGHRIIEIGCVEIINRSLTDRKFHVYLNPDMAIAAEAIKIHGITNDFLADKPHFKQIADDFIRFINGDALIIHNAPFDLGFINHEFAQLKEQTKRLEDFCVILDTLLFARKKHPGQRNSLDALCKRYGIDNSHRELHGALLDASILADIYLRMTGGQLSLLEKENTGFSNRQERTTKHTLIDRPQLKVIPCSDQENKDHQHKLDAIDKDSAGNCLWNS